MMFIIGMELGSGTICPCKANGGIQKSYPQTENRIKLQTDMVENNWSDQLVPTKRMKTFISDRDPRFCHLSGR